MPNGGRRTRRRRLRPSGFDRGACPTTCRDPGLWPSRLAEQIEVVGVDAWWAVGIAALGYPPIWASTGKEILRVLGKLSG